MKFFSTFIKENNPSKKMNRVTIKLVEYISKLIELLPKNICLNDLTIDVTGFREI